ncbi:immunoglobulin-like domain-containing protein [Paenibacillus hexagrammi]|uniref:Cadherin-like beta sandwich domain-containing protein n=1 Tax=Paenibacillus hexagrammi TaxID=2908839 RepID=A0ABY3SME7_9BACL|nr:immunoglobulin-like domain-containing protein [Paenibacillus sp. YPD9-1]UJF34590.1 cadherin-like beta sandwich domain-containing protein [Paenibacillus sp. YPD9-1]
MVSGGTSHALALKSDGSVWAWGDNTYSQLGDGTTEQSSSPKQVTYEDGTPLIDFVKVVAGGNHSMALRNDGTLWEWGGWSASNNMEVDIPYPQQVPLADPVKDMATTGYSCLALLEDGTVWGWGKNNWGQLATGSNEGDSSFYESPVQAVGPGGTGYLTDVVKLVSSDSLVAALTYDGKLYAWGNNYANYLALEDYTEDNWIVNVPTQITAFPEAVVDLEAGGNGLGAVLESGKVWATTDVFGNKKTQVFAGDSYYSFPEVTDGKQIAMGGSSIGVLTEAGKLWTCGVNGSVDNPTSSFILGNPDVGYQSIQAPVMGPNGDGYFSDGMYFNEGNNSAYVIRKDGTLWSWGSNQYGQLGIGVAGDGVTTNASKVPTAVTIDGEQFRLATSAVASLESISLNGVVVSGFTSDTKQYEVDLGSGTTSVTVAAVPTDSDSILTVNHASVSDNGSAEVALGAGTNTIGLEVTAPDGESKETYSVKINVGSHSEIPSKESPVQLYDDNSKVIDSANLPDGGSVLVETLPSNESQIMRTKYDGGIEKSMTFSYHKTVSVYPLSDTSGDLALVSNVTNGIELVKTDSDLTLDTPSTVTVTNDAEWTQKTAFKAKATSDGGVVIIGEATKVSSNWTMPYLVKLDADWNIEMETEFVISEDYPDKITDVVEDGSGGFVVTGTLSVGADSPSIMAVHLTSDGTMDNERSYVRDSYQEGQGIIRLEDGGYLLAGVSASNSSMSRNQGVWLLKLDSSLNLQWETFTESNGPVSVQSWTPLAEGGYAAAGMRDGVAALTVFNKDGYELWHVSDEGVKEWSHAQRTLDGGYLTGGTTTSGQAVYSKWSGPNLRLSHVQVDEEDKSVPVTVANPQEPDVISFDVPGSSSSVKVKPYLENTEMLLTADDEAIASGAPIDVSVPQGTDIKDVAFIIQTPDKRYTRSYTLELHVIPVNKEALSTIINQAQEFLDHAVVGTDAGQYPASAIDNLTAMLQSAKEVYDDPTSTPSTVDSTASMLEEELSSIPYEQYPYADKVFLASELRYASQMMAHGVQGTNPGNTPASAFAALQSAYNDAQAVMKNMVANQSSVDEVTEGLVNSIQSFQDALILPSPTYFEDFENDNGGFHTEGTISSWEYGTPDYENGPVSANSGSKAWGTNLSGNYLDNEDSYLVSGPIDASGTVVNKLLISASMWEQTESGYDYGYLDVSKDGGQTWDTVYKSTSDSEYSEGEEVEWEEELPPTTGTVSWKKHIFELDPSYAVSNLKLRFHLTSDGSVSEPGVYVDDVAVYVLKDTLESVLHMANDKLISMEEGTLPGQYRYGAVSLLQHAYSTAQQVNNDTGATEEHRAEQLNILQHSLHAAEGLKVSAPLASTVPNGSIVSYSGLKWIMLDNESGKMVSTESIGTSIWSEVGANSFNPAIQGSVAYQLNHPFLESLTNSDWIQDHAWDVTGLDGRIWNDTATVSAKVGLLSAQDYLQYGSVYPGGSGTLMPLENSWTLTPMSYTDSEDNQSVYQIDPYGYLSYSYRYSTKEMRPVIFVRTDLVQSAGTGTNEDPYTLTLDTDDLQVSRSSLLLPDWFKDINSGIDFEANTVSTDQILLPTQDADGVTITWNSSQPSMINPVTGEVQHPLPGESDAVVDLTATVGKQEAAHSLSFTLTVPALQDPIEHPITDMSIQNAQLSPAFDPDVHDYQISLSDTADVIVLRPSLNGNSTMTVSDATYTVSGLDYLIDTGSADSFRLEGQTPLGTKESYIFSLVRLKSQKSMLYFSVPNQKGTALIDNINHTVTAQVYHGVDLTSVMPVITVSDGAAYLPSAGTVLDFSSPVTYILTAQDGSSQQYQVTVTEAPDMSSAEVKPLGTEPVRNVPFGIQIYQAKDINGSLLTGSVHVVVDSTDLQEGVVFDGLVSFTDGEALLPITLSEAEAQTLTITLAGVSRPLFVTVNVQLPDADIVEADKTALVLSSILGSNADASHVTMNLELPTLGVFGSTINWSSDHRAIAADGTVTRPTSTNGDAIVHLTATFSKGMKKQQVVFEITVLSLEPVEYGTPVVVTSEEPIVFSGGVKLDLQSLNIPNGTTVTAEPVTPITTGTTLQQAGPVVKFTFQGMQTNPLPAPVNLQFAVDPGTDISKIGIFYYNEATGKWEYQRTIAESSNKVSAYVSHFSTYGVFTADQAAAPIANPESGAELQPGMSVTLATATDGAAIRYTLDGSEPTASSILYSNIQQPTAVAGSDLIVKAFAQKDGMIDSIVQTFTYSTASLSSNTRLGSIVVSTDSAQLNLLTVTSDGSAVPSLYTTTVPSVVSAVYVSAAAEYPGAHVDMYEDGQLISVNDAVYAVNLNVGVNRLQLVVTAENGDQQTYTLNVNRLGASNADITSMKYENVPLTQVGNLFTLRVGWDVDAVDLDVSLSDPHAYFTVTGATYGMDSIHMADLSFDPASNISAVNVTAQDGTVKTYSVQVVRTPEPTDAVLDGNHDGSIRIDDIVALVREQYDVDGNGFDANDVKYLLSRIQPKSVQKQ